jgi:hypothetical protein
MVRQGGVLALTVVLAGRCEIRAVSRERSPILLYRGICREAAPSHAVRLAFEHAPRSGADAIAIEVVCIRDGVLRKWLFEVPLPASTTGH